jgi:UDP-N-acetylglucosamine 1-carboxyvinyltransferase
VLTIEGVESLHEGEGVIIPDQLEAGTLAIAVAASKGHVVIEEFVAEDHDMLLLKFGEMGVNYKMLDARTIEIKPSIELKAVDIQTQPYPGLPSDLQAPFAVLMTQAKGRSEIFEIMYEGRLNYLFELQRMGAETSIRDPHVGQIEGPTRLHGTELISFDIRAGATILIAALIAEGTTTIDRVEHIDRGYEFFDKRLVSLGARMKRVD